MTTKIRYLTATVLASKDEIGKATLNFQMKISELQPTTPLEVQEKRGPPIRENMGTLDASVTDYVMMFDQTMELWMNL